MWQLLNLVLCMEIGCIVTAPKEPTMFSTLQECQEHGHYLANELAQGVRMPYAATCVRAEEELPPMG